jgi:hypothetical protein
MLQPTGKQAYLRAAEAKLTWVISSDREARDAGDAWGGLGFLSPRAVSTALTEPRIPHPRAGPSAARPMRSNPNATSHVAAALSGL